MILLWRLLTVCLLPFLTLPTEGATNTGCPEECVCAAGDIVKCSRLNTFPQDVPKDTVSLTISEFRFNDFPVRGLGPFKHLSAIHFQNGHFERIGACSFDKLIGLETFEMYNVTIETLDRYAFTNIRNVSEISIHNSKIGVIRSRAFNNVSSVLNIQMFQMNVTRIESYAFNNLNNVGMFNFFMNTVREMHPRAIYHVGTDITLTISSSEFFRLGCQTIDYLIIRLGNRVSFYENSVFCGCHSAWMGRGESREVLAKFMKETTCIASQGTDGSSPKQYLWNVTLTAFQNKCKDFNGGECTNPDELKQSKEAACLRIPKKKVNNSHAINSAAQVPLFTGMIVLFVLLDRAISTIASPTYL